MLKTEENKQKLAYALGALATLFLPYEEAAKVSAATQAIPDIARQAFSKLYERVSNQLSVLTTRDDVESAMFKILEPAYEQASALGKLAAGRMRDPSEADIVEVTKQWESEREFVKALADEVKAGRVSEAQFAKRVQMYGYALREVFNRSWVYHKTSPVFQWHMHDGVVHCSACIAANASSGSGLPDSFYRIGELPFYPGRSPVCLDNCMCWLESADGDVGAPQIRQPANSRD